MDIDLQRIGFRVKQARMSRHLSQQQLAEAAGVSATFLSHVENGKQSMNLRTLISISDALGVTADWLIKDDQHPSSQISSQIEKELSACTPKEREAILQLIQQMKKTIISIKNNDND